jgi:hypothetical protein
MVDPEICICAALQLATGEIIRGHRHDSCFQTILRRPGDQSFTVTDAVQGFMTSRNRFVNRKEGMQLQQAAGIKSAQTGQELRGVILFSEDLY